ncbi:MAG: rhodanese-like domain-containing protein [Calditrichales bacterium]|nr:MAG: rhodanese-like domain-containing protein [Calditrichales bacterium]
MKISLPLIIIAVLFISILVYSFREQTPREDDVTVQDVRKKIQTDSSLVLLDVRTAEEFNGALGHLPGGILIPLNELESRLSELADYRQQEIIVYCRSGNRSRTATNMMREKGFNAFNMLGGMKAWNAMMAADTTGVK